MMRAIVAWSLQFRFLVVIIAAALMIAGTGQLRGMPVDALPEFAPPFIEVQIEALGLNTPEVESLVTLNLEEMLTGVSWVQTIRSKSVPGMASVTLIFEPGTDLNKARQLVQERLLLAHLLPNVSTPPVIIQPLSATSRVMMVGISSKTLSPVELGVLARWKIRPALMGATGVANVAVWGHRERQLQVLVEPERLRAIGVSLDQVIETAGNAMWVSPLSWLKASTPGAGGWIDGPQQRLEVRHVLPISAPADMARVSVERTVGLTLGDVAEVVEDYPPVIGDALLSGGSGILLVVEKFPGASPLEVTRAVEATLATLQPGLAGVDIDPTVFRPVSFIETAIGNLTKALALGAFLLVLVFFAFLRHWRLVLVGVVAIPLSLLAALFVLDLRGATANVMVLAGLVIALGVVIDDASGDVLNIGRRLSQRARQEGTRSTAQVIVEAAAEIRGPMAFATLIVLAAVVPFLLFQGVNGSFLQPLVVSYGLAVLASMVVALLVTPALSLLLLSRAVPEPGDPPLVRWLQPRYERALGWTYRAPRLNVAAVAVGLLGLVTLPFLGQQPLVPPFKEPQLLVQWDGAPSMSHPAMTRITTEASRELRAIPGVRGVSAHVGRAVLGDQVVGINSAQLWVTIDPANHDRTVAAVQDVLDGYPGLVRTTQTYTQQAVRKVLTGSGDDIVVRLFGPEFPVLTSKAEEVQRAIASIEGVVDLQIERQIEEPHVSVRVDLAKAELYGLKPGDVRRAASTLVNGIQVGSLFEAQKVFEVVVWGTPAVRSSLTNIRDLLIDTPRGGHVRLADLADIRVAPTLHTINREAVSRRVDVSFNVRGRDVGAVTGDVERAIQRIGFPLEYHAELLGEYAERQTAQQRIAIAGVAALIGIFLLLQAAFQSWRLAALAFVVLPWALVGGVLAAFLVNAGGALSLGSALGLLTILGVAARSAIVTIRHFQELEQEGGQASGAELVQRGARDRLAPILMTALATGLALVPFVLFGGAPGHEIVGPMAVVILSGLVTSTLLNLFILPAAYLRFRGGAYSSWPTALVEPA